MLLLKAHCLSQITKILKPIQNNTSEHSMWPNKASLGTTITYGMNGTGLYLAQNDEDEPWQLPRCRNLGNDFQIVTDSSFQLQPPFKPELQREKQIVDNKNSDFLCDIPNTVLTKYEQEQALLESELVYDPTVGDAVKLTKIKDFAQSTHREVILYPTEPKKNVLVAKLVGRETGVLVREEEEDRDEQSEKKKGTTKQNPKEETITNILTPYIEEMGCQIKLDSGIRQIETFRNSPNATFQLKFQHVLVRTVRSLYLIQIIIHRDLRVELKIRHYLNCEDFHGFEFSHVTVDPFQLDRCAVIDTKGNWQVLKVSKYSETFVHFQKGVILDFEDVSNFKRIKWLDNANELLLISRIAVKKVNLQTAEATELISGNRWSVMRDYTSYDSDDKYGFLLTSRELMLIDVSAGFKRLLVWKHFLDPLDPSLRFAVKAVKDVNYVIVHSVISPLIVIFQFKFSNDLPFMTHDPILLRVTEGEVMSYEIALNLNDHQKENNSENDQDEKLIYDEDEDEDEEDDESYHERSLTLFRLTTDLEFTQEIISHGAFYLEAQEQQEVLEDATTIIGSNTPFYRSHNRKVIYNVKDSSSFKRFEKALNVVPATNTDTDQQELIEKLTKYTRSLHIENDQPPSTLLEKATPLNVFEFEEYDEIMEQLGSHCEHIGVDFASFTKYISHLIPIYAADISRLQNISLLAEYFNKLYPYVPEIHHKILTRDLALSIYTVTDPIREKAQLKSAQESLKGTKLRKILSDWDEEYDEYIPENEEYGSSTPSVQHHSRVQSQMDDWSQPVIRVSQSQRPSSSLASSQIGKTSSQRHLSSQGLIRPKKRDFSSSQLQAESSQGQSTPTSSQTGFGIGSSQKSGSKKKKRKSGFA